MRVIVLEPNGINDSIHIHRKGCREVYAPRNRGRNNWDFDASSEQQIIEELFYSSRPTVRNDARIFPCVKFEIGMDR